MVATGGLELEGTNVLVMVVLSEKVVVREKSGLGGSCRKEEKSAKWLSPDLLIIPGLPHAWFFTKNLASLVPFSTFGSPPPLGCGLSAGAARLLLMD